MSVAEPIVAMADLRALHAEIAAELEAAVLEVVRSGAYIQGAAVAAFEREVAAHLAARHAIGVSSGTDALLVSLIALGIGVGDRVVTTAYSFFATAGAIARLGAVPVFVDVDPRTCNVDPAAAARALDDARVRAVVPVHLYGRCAELEPILAAARARGVPVVEDAAQAIGATYRGRRAGTLGAVGAFSCFPTKNLGALGDAGFVVTDDDALAERIRTLRVHGARARHEHVLVGGNFRLDTIQAAALRALLPHVERWNQRRRALAARYDEALAALPLERPPPDDGHVYHHYVVALDDRDRLRARLADRGVETAVFYPTPLHLQPCFAELGYRRGALPASERAAARTLALPVHPALTRAQQDHVIEAVTDALR